ncbi:MAG: VTT domain-containing protein [Planctomycetota bacterium]|nr:VTT domain-containing protein [Planctomycetota bacterium]
MSDADADPTALSTWAKRCGLLVALLLLVAAGRLLPIEQRLDAVKTAVSEMGPAAPLAYGVFYVAAALAFVPGSAITLAAGALFGVGLGTAVVSVASTTAAAVAFPLARTLLRSRVERLAASSRGFAAIDDAVADGGWRVVGLLRLSPVVPFSALNYLLGLTRVAYLPAILVSWAAMLPGTLLYVYLGAVGADVAAGASKGWEEWTLLGVGLAATLTVTLVLTRAARARMRSADAAPGP